MTDLNRRQFIKKSTVAGIILSAAGLPFEAEAKKGQKIKSVVDKVELGHTGIKVPLLAQGTGIRGGHHESEHTRMGQEAFNELVRYGFERKLRFLDMADSYGTHPYMKNALQGIPRDQYVLLSKIWPTHENWTPPSGGAIKEVDRFRAELGVDMLDICLIHCMMDENWPEKFEKIRDELSELKQKRVVRAVGVSCHDFGALAVAASHPWVDVILARINHMGGREYFMDSTVEEVSKILKLARSNGKAVIGMKIFAMGKLTKPEEKDASIQYVLKNQLVDAMTIGMTSKEQMDDTISRIDKALKSI